MNQQTCWATGSRVWIGHKGCWRTLRCLVESLLNQGFQLTGWNMTKSNYFASKWILRNLAGHVSLVPPKGVEWWVCVSTRLLYVSEFGHKVNEATSHDPAFPCSLSMNPHHPTRLECLFIVCLTSLTVLAMIPSSSNSVRLHFYYEAMYCQGGRGYALGLWGQMPGSRLSSATVR